jgi:hypothetical protein
VNAFEAPERGGRSTDLQAELENLFDSSEYLQQR